jgi:hypothetical protein
MNLMGDKREIINERVERFNLYRIGPTLIFLLIGDS